MPLRFTTIFHKSITATCSITEDLVSGAIYRPDSFVLMLRHCVNLKAIRYESTCLNRIAADKSHRVIVALSMQLIQEDLRSKVKTAHLEISLETEGRYAHSFRVTSVESQLATTGC